MTIELKKINDQLLHVNGKKVRYDMNGVWVMQGFLPTLEEAKAVADFVEMQKRFGTFHKFKMTYKPTGL